MAEHIPGYVLPIHRSLTEPILIAGVPRTIAILNGTFVAALGLGLHSFFALPLGLMFHLLAVGATKIDPQFFECYRRHVRQKNHYTA